jgi:glycine/sarcosine N-methyltransferase
VVAPAVQCVMAADAKSCYDDLADDYHLIFENWEASMVRQAETLGLILQRECGSPESIRVLDCACGIGTQSLGLAKLGFTVIASDLSARAVARLQREALQRGLSIASYVSNILDLNPVAESNFDAVICMDNALPHLESQQQLVEALSQIRTKLQPAGLFMASIRDYDRCLEQKPVAQEPSFYSDHPHRRIVFQLWDWLDDRSYVFHIYITQESGAEWRTVHATAVYHALTRDELTNALKEAKFSNIRWLLPAESGFYQPMVLAQADAVR